MKGPVAGMQLKGFDLKPYFVLLLDDGCPSSPWQAHRPTSSTPTPKCSALPSSSDFATDCWPYKLLYELSYGIDFLTIEVFFRGFLILAFARYAGKEAILPMAAFYCCIHFGKPLCECITSYFGGIDIRCGGVDHTRSIWGGLIVHLGIAWLMELVALSCACKGRGTPF